jgi:hypothetical protein
MLPYLKDTKLNPTELWDKNGGTADVKRPDWDSLTGDALILIFPTNVGAVSEIRAELEIRGHDNFCFFDDIVVQYLTGRSKSSESPV